MREGVRAGLGIALLPRQAVHRELAGGELVALRVQGFPVRRSWCLVHARGKALSPVAQRLKQFVRDHAAVVYPLCSLGARDGRLDVCRGR